MTDQVLPILKASTLVLTAPLSGRVNSHLLFKLLPVTYPKTISGLPIQFTKKRMKIPYYGVEGCIISLRYDGKVRGARVGGAFMNSSISVDLQVCRKNIHIKISGSKLHLTGALSEEMASTAFTVICWHINSIQGHIDHIHSLSEEKIEKTLAWIASTVKGEFVEYDYLVNEMTEEMVASIPEKEGVDVRMATFLLLYTFDFRYGSETKLYAYGKHINEIVQFARSPCPRISDKENIISGSQAVNNAVYNYNIGTAIVCGQFALFTKSLFKDPSREVSFINWHSSAVTVFFHIKEQSDSKVRPSGDPKMKAHRFIINPSGTIRQTSPTVYSEAVDAYYEIADIIGKYLVSIGTLPEGNSKLQITAADADEDSELSDTD
jgi:hypothetical protein